MRVHIGAVLERARECEGRLVVSKVTSTAKDKRLCSQARAIINRVVDYLARLKIRNGCRSPLKPSKLPVSDCDELRWAFLKATNYVKGVYQAPQYTVRHFKSSNSSCSQSMAQIEKCY